MTLKRSFGLLREEYDREHSIIHDTEENIACDSTIEFDCGTCECEFFDVWPQYINLSATIIPKYVKDFDNNATIERIEEGRSKSSVRTYDKNNIDPRSHIQNIGEICSEVLIKFEEYGEYSIFGTKEVFFGNCFKNYSIANVAEDVLFSKSFMVQSNALIENYQKKEGELIIISDDHNVSSRIYAYGGFYFHGIHPSEIESCVFSTSSVNERTNIKISKLSAWKNVGIDPTVSGFISKTQYVQSMNQFSAKDKMSLSDELKSGACEISLLDNYTNLASSYVSKHVVQVPNTNSILIKFVKK